MHKKSIFFVCIGAILFSGCSIKESPQNETIQKVVCTEYENMNLKTTLDTNIDVASKALNESLESLCIKDSKDSDTTLNISIKLNSVSSTTYTILKNIDKNEVNIDIESSITKNNKTFSRKNNIKIQKDSKKFVDIGSNEKIDDKEIKEIIKNTLTKSIHNLMNSN